MLTQVGFLALLATSAIAAPVAQQQGYGVAPAAPELPSAGAGSMEMPPMYGEASLKEAGATTSSAGPLSTDPAAPKDESEPAPLGNSPVPEPAAGGQPLCGTEPYDPNQVRVLVLAFPLPLC